MPKETPAVVGTDPIEIIGQQRAIRSTRGEPKCVEMQQRDVVVRVQHGYDVGCDVVFGGTIARTADTRFRVRHGCQSIPNLVTVQRIDNEVGWQSDGGSTNGVRMGDDPVPDTTAGGTTSGYNPTFYRNTQTYGGVLINNCQPYADAQYAYFTVAFPITLWSVIGKFALTGSFFCEVPEYCGLVLSATAQVWGVPTALFSLGVTVGTATGNIDPTVSTCGAGTGGSVKQEGYPNQDNRVIQVSAQGAAGTWENALVLVNAFCAPRNASRVRVRVISQVWENVGAPQIVISPSADAQPAA